MRKLIFLVVAPPAAGIENCWHGADRRCEGWPAGGREGSAGLGWHSGKDSPEHCDEYLSGSWVIVV